MNVLLAVPENLSWYIVAAVGVVCLVLAFLLITMCIATVITTIAAIILLALLITFLVRNKKKKKALKLKEAETAVENETGATETPPES